MTPQEVYDKVARHLLTQRRKAEEPGGAGQCRYRYSGYGTMLKCAGGCLIPDDKYNEALEGNIVTAPQILEAIGLKVTDPVVDVLRQLQLLHDNVEVEMWWMSLRDLAVRFKLSDAVLNEFPGLRSC